MVHPLSLDNFWISRSKFDDAERIFYEAKYGGGQTLVLNERYTKLVKEKQNLNKTIDDLRKSISKLEVRINSLEKSSGKSSAPVAAKKAEPEKKEDDDDIDLFGSDDEEDEEAEKMREERAKAAAVKKQKKGVIAKSNVVLDIKPWDDETDMAAMEQAVRSIKMEGLLWGVSKLVPVAFGVKKLQIVCVVEDEKVSIDELTEKIEAFEDYVQSIDIQAFQKI